nr:alanine and proline-rich secreted protein Apa [Mycobacterium tuberculosis]
MPSRAIPTQHLRRPTRTHRRHLSLPQTHPNLSGSTTRLEDSASRCLLAGWSLTPPTSTTVQHSSAKPPGTRHFPDQPPPVANDTRIVLGRLDQKLYASAEATDSKAAARLGSDMGEFYMPYPGTRINQETVSLDANGVSGSASYYEVKFSDPSKPNGQIWTGVIGSPAANAPDAGPPQRWFVVWLGTANNPVDKGAAKALAESIRPLVAPPPAPAPAPAEPAPAPAPAGEVAPTPTTPTPQRTLPA